jgi:DNA-binding FadR family transcriptional regulator
MSNRDPLVKRKMTLIVAQRIVRDIRRHGLVPGDGLPHEQLMREEYALAVGRSVNRPLPRAAGCHPPQDGPRWRPGGR